MATIETRRNADGTTSYRARVRVRGHRPETATFGRRTDAKAWAKGIEAAIQEGRHLPTVEARRHTLAELIDRYIRDVIPQKSPTAAKQTPQLNWWRAELGDLIVADVSRARIAEARDRLASSETKPGVRRSPSTVNRYLAALSHAFTIAVREWGWLESNPAHLVRRLPEPNGRVRFLSPEEREHLLAACKASPDSRLYPVVMIALLTGARAGEILGLRWADVDLQRGRLTFHRTKNKERRGVRLAAPALEALRDYAKVRRIDTELVFPGPKGDGPGEPRKAWLAALKAAKIEGFRFHDLRHSAASELAMMGASPSEIAAILGHKTLSMVKRYSHIADAHSDALLDRLAERVIDASQRN